MLKRRVALILRVGRPHYRTSLASLMQSLARYHNCADRIFRLYLAYDVGATPSADEIRSLTDATQQSVACFEEVVFLTDKDRRYLVDWVRQTLLVPDDVLEVIFARIPYSFQLNCALLTAIRDAMDVALLFDDDGYFWVPVDDINGTRHWIHADPIGGHLVALDAGATVSVGEIAGARSPIPEALRRALPDDVLSRLGTFFEGASEVLGNSSFLSSGYKPLRHGPSTPTAVYPWHREWVTPANMAIKLASKFPVFFNPPGARGEDAFFALAMQEHDTLRTVESAVFHDPFNLFPSIALGSFPRSLNGQALTPEMLTRFRTALYGWVSYMPLFIRLTQPPHLDNLSSEIEGRRALLLPLAKELASHLRDPKYDMLVACFDSYYARVDADCVDWIQANRYWRHTILPAVQKRFLLSGEEKETRTMRSIWVPPGRVDR